MCGIAGFILKNKNEQELKSLAHKFVQSIKHRGPDGQGINIIDGVCVLNTRLSIIDIAHGQQPLYGDGGNITLVQNGEIYNYVELRAELKKLGFQFKTQSDSEVILAAYELYGTECFNYFNGMFAIAIIDIKRGKLILARDRLGVKPIYYYKCNNELLFSSEIKTFKEYPGFNGKVSNEAIHLYMKFNYVPLPTTMFEYVKHVMPGCFYEIDLETLRIEENKYWSIKNESEISIQEGELLDAVDELLIDAVKIRLRADVDAAAFLSGGLDSSLVVAIAKKHCHYDLNTFSIGFYDKRFDESLYAKDVADYLGLKNHLKILDSDIIKLWEATTWYNDQPHGDISFIPTYILSEFTAMQYKIALTGDGGDELFAGYVKYFDLLKNKANDDYFNHISLIENDYQFLDLYTDDFYKKVDIKLPLRLFHSVIGEVSQLDEINKALYLDSRLLLPGNNLVKPDKMGMANSLEARSPFMDYRLYELLFRIPGSYKLRDHTTKYILKKLALRYLPENIVYRNKQMFTVPVGEWFKDTLKTYTEEIINSASLARRNIFKVESLNRMLAQHVSGARDYTRELRAIINLEIWFRVFLDS
jgi:asparagine synthase (glutamine-hydrolysing)